jgi:hypothetical protein
VAALLVVLVLAVQRMAGGLRSGNASEGAKDEAYSRPGVAAARVRERPPSLDRDYGDLEQSETGAQPGRSPDAAGRP